MGKTKKAERARCSVSWNEDIKPHTARCTNTQGHKGKHRDSHGRTLNLGSEKERGGEGE